MQAVPRPHENWKSVLLAGRISPDHVNQFATLLATIHRRGYEQRTTFAPIFSDRSVFESLRVEPYYLYTATQVAQAREFLKQLVTDTRLRQLTLVHGDYSPKNILIHDDRLILLDHEVIHFGDPAFDLGFSMTHFLSKGHHLPAHRRAFADAARSYWQIYRQTLGDLRWTGDLEELAVRHALGCLLARVAGRSPLEYLTEAEKAWQRAVVLTMMTNMPATIEDLIETFLDRE
jgi:aminoglycoside phosphotransferase (APT) family kinase protein